MYENTVFGRLDQKLQHAISDTGYETPTPIQEKSMPYLLEGRDLLGCAQTGTGKTAAFMLPILNRLVQERRPRHIGHPRVLVLSPTRELAAQTADNVKKFSKYCQMPFACVVGGVSQFGQVKDIKKGAELVIACPGRLMDLMTQGIVYLDQVECFVLDEADRMLDMGFLPDIKRIVSKLPKARQSMFFSATMAGPILKLAAELVQDPASVTINPETPTVDKINQKLMFVPKSQKDALLRHLLENHPEWYKVIVFTKMRHGADRVCKKLVQAGVTCAAIPSDKTQGQRTRALEGFRKGDIQVLVATDIASRGIDVPEVSCVINMELPLEPEVYVHRIGRTARAGESGAAISFVAPDEKGLLKAVERLIRKTIPVDRDHPFEAQPDLPPPSWEQPSDSRGPGNPRGPANPRGPGKPRNAGMPKNTGKPVHPANQNRNKQKRQGHKSFLGRHQSDFGQK